MLIILRLVTFMMEVREIVPDYVLDLQIFVIDTLPDDGTLVPNRKRLAPDIKCVL
jgi:hypothetical protein